tara:strand:- start:584 stop:889 length:306 start_codon:yes stop_codon:yes gene_type:complete
VRLLVEGQIFDIKKAGFVYQLVFRPAGVYFFLVGYYFRLEFTYERSKWVSFGCFWGAATYHLLFPEKEKRVKKKNKHFLPHFFTLVNPLNKNKFFLTSISF